MAREGGAPVIQFAYESQPRAALGYTFVLLLGLVYRLGLIGNPTDDIAEAVEVMENWQEEIEARVPVTENLAKELATRVAGRLPVVYGAGFLTAAANRWKTQFNENAKHWAFFEMLPELNHNAVVGFGIPEVVREHSIGLMLRSHLESQRMRARWDVTLQLLERADVATQVVFGRGESALAQMLSLIHFGDYVSFYLAVLNDVDPTPVSAIAFLKERLADLGQMSE
jgi:glucose/mannose-6-phosphate isomerase